jgi:hypothetical protein
VTSANILDPDLKAVHDQHRRRHGSRNRRTWRDGELQLHEDTDLFGNFAGTITPCTASPCTDGAGFTGTLFDGTPHNGPDSEPGGDYSATTFTTTNVLDTHQLQRHRNRPHQAPVEQVDEPLGFE